MFRYDAYDNTWNQQYKYFRDSHQFYHLMQKGKACLFSFIGGVYRRTGNGIYTNMDRYQLLLKTILVYREMWKINEDERLREPYAKSMQYFIDLLCQERQYRKDLLSMSWCLFCLTKQVKQFLKNLMRIQI